MQTASLSRGTWNLAPEVGAEFINVCRLVRVHLLVPRDASSAEAVSGFSALRRLAVQNHQSGQLYGAAPEFRGCESCPPYHVGRNGYCYFNEGICLAL
jgi:hypothetical protein